MALIDKSIYLFFQLESCNETSANLSQLNSLKI
jgi:hypothetical protein